MMTSLLNGGLSYPDKRLMIIAMTVTKNTSERNNAEVYQIRKTMSDLISKGKLLNKIATECHYSTEEPLQSYAKLLAVVNDMETEDELLTADQTEQHR